MESESKGKVEEKDGKIVNEEIKLEENNKIYENINNNFTDNLEKNSNLVDSIFLNESELNNNEAAKTGGPPEILISESRFPTSNSVNNKPKILNCNESKILSNPSIEFPKVSQNKEASKLTSGESLDSSKQRRIVGRNSLQDENMQSLNNKKNGLENRADYGFSKVLDDSGVLPSEIESLNTQNKNNLNSKKTEDKYYTRMKDHLNNSLLDFNANEKIRLRNHSSIRNNSNNFLKTEEDLNNSLDNIYIYDHNKLRNRKPTGNRIFKKDAAKDKTIENKNLNKEKEKENNRRIIIKKQDKEVPQLNKIEQPTEKNTNKIEKPMGSSSKCSLLFKFILIPLLLLIFTFFIIKKDNLKFELNEYYNALMDLVKVKINQFRSKNNSAKYDLVNGYIAEVIEMRTKSKFTLNSITNDFRIDSFDFKEITNKLAKLKKNSSKDFALHFNNNALYLIKREYQLSDFSENFIRNFKDREAVKSLFNPSFILINLFENSEFNLLRKLNFLIASRNPIPLYYPSISIENYNKVLKNKNENANKNDFAEEIYKNFEGNILQYKLNKDFYYFMEQKKKNFLAFSFSETIGNGDPLNLINDVFKSKFDVFTNFLEQVVYNHAVFFYTDYDTMNEKTKKNFNIAYCYGKNAIFNENNSNENKKIKNICLDLLDKFDYVFITVNQKDFIKKETMNKVNFLLKTYLNTKIKIFFLVNSEKDDIKKNIDSKDSARKRQQEADKGLDLSFTYAFSDLFIDEDDLILDITKDVTEKILKLKRSENCFFINFHKSNKDINSDELRSFLFAKLIKNTLSYNKNNNDKNDKAIFKAKKKQLANFFNTFSDQSKRSNYNNRIEASEQLVKNMLLNVKNLIREKKDILDYNTNYFSIYPIFMFLKEQEALKKKMNIVDMESVQVEKRYYELKNIYESKLANGGNLFGKAYKDFKNFLEQSLRSDDLNFNVSLLSKKLQSLIKKIMQPIKIEIERNRVNSSEENQTGLLDKQLQNNKLERKLLLNSLSIEYFWREAMLHYENSLKITEDNQRNKNSNSAQKEIEFRVFFTCYKQLIESGEPFEILDGDNNYIYKDFIFKAFEDKQNKRIFRILMLGQQNTGKSTLLNILFGTVFKASDGRCTKGIYGSFISSNNEAYDYTLILDTEGLDSFEKADREYDDIFSLFTLSMTDAMVINVKDQLTGNFESIISNAAKNLKDLKLHKNTSLKMFIVFNQKQDPKSARIQYKLTLDKVVKKFNENKIKDVLSLDSEKSLFVLPLAYTTENVLIKHFSSASAGKSDQNDNENWNIYYNLEEFFIASNSLKNELLDFSLDYTQRENEQNMLFSKFMSNVYRDHEQLKSFKNIASSLEYRKRIEFEKLEKKVNELILKHCSDRQKQKLKENFLEFEIKRSKSFDEVKNSLMASIEKTYESIKEQLIKECDLIECDLGNKNKILAQLDRRAKTTYEAWSNEFFIDGLIAEMNNEKDNKFIEIQNMISHKFLTNKTFTQDLAYEEYDDAVKSIKADLDKNYNKSNIISNALKYTNNFYSIFTKTPYIVFSSYSKFEKVQSPQDYELLYDSLLKRLLAKNALFSEYNNKDDKFIIDNYFSLKYALKEFVFLNKTVISNIYLVCNESFYKNVKEIENFEKRKIKSFNEFNEFNKELEKHGLSIDKSEYSSNTKEVFTPKIKDLEILECKVPAQFLKKLYNIFNYLNPFKFEDNAANFDNEDTGVAENDITFKILKFIKNKLFEAKGFENPNKIKNNFDVEKTIKEIFDIKVIFNEVKNIVNSQTEDYVKNRKGMIPIDVFNIIASGIENKIIDQINSELRIFKLEITTIFKQKIQNFALKLLLKIAATKLITQVEDIKTEFFTKAKKLRKDFISYIYSITNTDNYTSIEIVEILNEHYYKTYFKNLGPDVKSDLYQKNNLHIELSSNSIIKSTYNYFKTNINNTKEKQALIAMLKSYVKDPIEHIKSVFNSNFEKKTQTIKEAYVNSVFLKINRLNNAIVEVFKSLKAALSYYNPKGNSLSKEKFNKENLIQIINAPKSGDKSELEKSLDHYYGKALLGLTIDILSNSLSNSNMVYNKTFIFSVDMEFENFIKSKFSVADSIRDKEMIESVKLAFQDLKQSIKKRNSSKMNNLFDFVSILLDNFDKKGFAKSRIQNTTDSIFQEIKEELKNKICKTTCPLCGAPCDHSHDGHQKIGEEGSKHRCINGHFFPAFKGFKYESNSEGVLKKCTKFSDEDVFVWKGQSFNWKNFLHTINKWEIVFEEGLSGVTGSKDIVNEIWREVGTEICRENRMKFVLENSLVPSEYFFTFILDNSGSMVHSIPQLKHAFGQTLNFIHNKMRKARMNLILFNSESEILVENQIIDSAYSDLVQICSQGCLTNYSDAFEKTVAIVKKYRGNKHFIVFFTDGAPTSIDHMSYVASLKNQLRDVNLNKFVSIYFGNASHETLDLNEITNYLNGKIFRPSDVSQLENVFQVEIPKIILPDDFENIDDNQ